MMRSVPSLQVAEGVDGSVEGGRAGVNTTGCADLRDGVCVVVCVGVGAGVMGVAGVGGVVGVTGDIEPEEEGGMENLGGLEGEGLTREGGGAIDGVGFAVLLGGIVGVGFAGVDVGFVGRVGEGLDGVAVGFDGEGGCFVGGDVCFVLV
jgi:hypothetical protein